MIVRQKYGGAPWLYEEATGDIVGVKDPDGSEFLWSRAANFGLFRDMSDQSTTANTPTAIQFDTPIIQNGITLVDNTKLLFARGGFFNFTLTAQLYNTDTAIQDMFLWGRLNGDDIEGTATRVCVTESHGGSPGAVVLERSYFAGVQAGDYIEVMWMVEDAQVILKATSAVTGPPAMPSGPSVNLAIFEFAR